MNWGAQYRSSNCTCKQGPSNVGKSTEFMYMGSTRCISCKCIHDKTWDRQRLFLIRSPVSVLTFIHPGTIRSKRLEKGQRRGYFPSFYASNILLHMPFPAAIRLAAFDLTFTGTQGGCRLLWHFPGTSAKTHWMRLEEYRIIMMIKTYLFPSKWRVNGVPRQPSRICETRWKATLDTSSCPCARSHRY
jgi:hypothetical protein